MRIYGVKSGDYASPAYRRRFRRAERAARSPGIRAPPRSATPDSTIGAYAHFSDVGRHRTIAIPHYETALTWTGRSVTNRPHAVRRRPLAVACTARRTRPLVTETTAAGGEHRGAACSSLYRIQGVGRLLIVCQRGVEPPLHRVVVGWRPHASPVSDPACTR
jgi:hypothetical protein